MHHLHYVYQNVPTLHTHFAYYDWTALLQLISIWILNESSCNVLSKCTEHSLKKFSILSPESLFHHRFWNFFPTFHFLSDNNTFEKKCFTFKIYFTFLTIIYKGVHFICPRKYSPYFEQFVQTVVVLHKVTRV